MNKQNKKKLDRSTHCVVQMRSIDEMDLSCHTRDVGIVQTSRPFDHSKRLESNSRPVIASASTSALALALALALARSRMEQGLLEPRKRPRMEQELLGPFAAVSAIARVEERASLRQWLASFFFSFLCIIIFFYQRRVWGGQCVNETRSQIVFFCALSFSFQGEKGERKGKGKGGEEGRAYRCVFFFLFGLAGVWTQCDVMWVTSGTYKSRTSKFQNVHFLRTSLHTRD